MSTLLHTLTQQLAGDNLKKMAGHLGTDEKTTGAAVATALPVLLGALGRNAASPDGARALHGAVAKDHDGGLLDNPPAFFGKARQGPGGGILGHVFGGKRSAVEAGVARASGMDQAGVSNLMVMLAPVVLGAVGRTQRTQGLDASGLATMLGQERQAAEKSVPQAGMLTRLLDHDGDGDVDFKDLAARGAKAVSGVFGR